MLSVRPTTATGVPWRGGCVLNTTGGYGNMQELDRLRRMLAERERLASECAQADCPMVKDAGRDLAVDAVALAWAIAEIERGWTFRRVLMAGDCRAIPCS